MRFSRRESRARPGGPGRACSTVKQSVLNCETARGVYSFLTGRVWLYGATMRDAGPFKTK
jgi:hypothetical protein